MSTGPAAAPAGPRPGAGGAAAFARRNKVGIGVAAVAGVAGLALLRSKSSSSTGPKTAAYSDRVAATGQAQYDSSSSDVYNALQPALEGVSNQYDDLMSWLKTNGTPVPVPAPNGGAATPDLTTPDAAPRPTPPTLDGIATEWQSKTGSIYNAILSDGTTTAINQNDVWSGKFGGGYGTDAGGYAAAQADQIRDALAAKGLGYGRAGNTGGGYTEETAGGRVVQGY